MMHLNEIKAVCDILNDTFSTGWNGENWRVYENYSGRFMYGDRVHGLVCDDKSSSAQIDIVLAMMEYFRDHHRDDDCWQEALDWTRENVPTRYDNLGLSTIFY